MHFVLLLNSLQIKWSGMDASLSTTPFIDEIYDLLKETLSEYDVIISRWPEYIFPLESVCTAKNFSQFLFLFGCLNFLILICVFQ